MTVQFPVKFPGCQQLLSVIIINNYKLPIYSNIKQLKKWRLNNNIFTVNLLVSYFYGTGRYFADISKIGNCDAP